MCIEIYGFSSAYFLSSPRLVGQATLKKTKVKLDLLTDIDTLTLPTNLVISHATTSPYYPCYIFEYVRSGKKIPLIPLKPSHPHPHPLQKKEKRKE